MKINILKQTKIRGLIYAIIASAGISYEIFFPEEIRPFLIAAYLLVVFIGIIYYRRSPE